MTDSEDDKEGEETKQDDGMSWADMDSRHSYVFSIAALHLGLEKKEIEVAAIENQQIGAIKHFFKADGSAMLLCMFQDPNDSGQETLAEVDEESDFEALQKPDNRKILLTTDCTVQRLTGACVYFVRPEPWLPISDENLKTIGSGLLDVKATGSFFKALIEPITSFYVPVLNEMDCAWGTLTPKQDGRHMVEDCLSALLSFSHCLEAAELSLKETNHLAPCKGFDVRTLNNPTQAFHATMSPEIQRTFEKCLKQWMEQIRKILDESDQIRMEPDTIGPKSEMIYWKQRMSRFHGIMNQMRSGSVRLIIGALVAIKSRHVMLWREIDMKITDAFNEAKDNVQYLSVLERHWLPLYFNDPIAMVDNLSPLMTSLQNIQSVSKYYRYPDRMAAVFIKLTNQMILMCKSYINNNGLDTIWTQRQELVISKIKGSINLRNEYRKAYDKVQEKLRNTPNESPLNISEVLVFGRYETFCNRLECIIDILNTIEHYTHILTSNCENLLEIEKMKMMRMKFDELVLNMKTKTYDYLDHKHKEFDKHYAEFTKEIREIGLAVITVLEQQFRQAWATPQAITILRRLEHLNISAFDSEEKYKFILDAQYKELERIAHIYEAHKKSPPLAHDVSPCGGRILWCRQLLRHIEQKMDDASAHGGLIKYPKAKKVISLYNKIAKVLVQYEMDTHQAWFEEMDQVQACFRQPVLRRQGSDRKLQHNFSPALWVALRDCEIMSRMQFKIPQFGQILLKKKDKLRNNLTKIKLMLKRNELVRAKISPDIVVLMGIHLAQVNQKLEQGLLQISWSSLSLECYIEVVFVAIEKLEDLMDRINGICENRIEEALNSICQISLLELPTEEAYTLDQFLETTKLDANNAGLILEAKNKSIELAVQDLLYLILGENFFNSPSIFNYDSVESPDESDRAKGSAASLNFRSQSAANGAVSPTELTPQQALHQAAGEIHTMYNHRVLEAFIKLTKKALDELKNRISCSHSIESSEVSKLGPLFLVHVSLCIPRIIIQPSLEIVQLRLNKGVSNILDAFKRVSLWDKKWASKIKNSAVRNSTFEVKRPPNNWTFRRTNPNLSRIAPYNYFRSVSENKDLARIVLSLSQSLGEFEKDFASVLETFTPYEIVWLTDREFEVKKYLEKQLTWLDYENEIMFYRDLKDKALNEPNEIKLGALAFSTEKIKFQLEAEANGWIALLGRCCEQKYFREMGKLMFYIKDMTNKLSYSVCDLDDVRQAMHVLTNLRECEVNMELNIIATEECYQMLQKQEFDVSQDEIEQVDTLNRNWQRLRSQALDVQDLLLEIQKPFCDELINNIKTFNEDLTTFEVDYNKRGPMTPGLPPQAAYECLLSFQNRFDNLWRKFTTYQAGEELFGMIQSDYPLLQKVRKELNLLQKLYKLYVDVMDSINSYYEIQWSEIDVEVINNELLEFHNRCRKLPKALKEWPAFITLKKMIDDFSDISPLLELMSNKAMKSRHWQRIMEVIGCHIDIESNNCTLRVILEAPILQHKEDIEDICISAVKEKDIEAKLRQVTNEWGYTELTFASFKTRGELLLRGDNTAEIITRMEDSLVILGSLLNNRYNAPFRQQIQKWVQDLSNTAEILEKWLLVQNLWVYLEAVFVGGDIAKQLPKEARLFYNIDKSWQKIMQRAQIMANVLFGKKRFMFPRFFFVSDPALLEILGQASDPHTIQAHLLSIFDNTKYVVFHEQEYNRIMAIVSSEKETIQLHKPVLAVGTVETWLMKLIQTAQQSLHYIIRDAAYTIQEQNFKPLEFFNKFPAQVGLLGLQMYWTRESESAIMHSKHDKRPMIETNKKFLDLLNGLIEKTTYDDYSKVERIKLETLITIHVHQRDIFNTLCQMNIRSLTDFEWLKQCRFYFKEDFDKMLVSITDINFTYQNEFLGCTDRLVITPLTDRCYITLAQAIGMSMGGCSAGPAGTGKTETVKDMGKTLGKYVVVFNCSDQMDYRGLGRIFKGLAHSGSWGCFDEFNRIDLPVLSVAAQQIACILSCKKEKRQQFVFTDGDLVDLNTEFGIFTTMNPGYAGRHELPENLKIQFRTVAMMVPDRQIIIRVKLASCGYLENITLARKFYTLYKLCEEQLTKQVHYDFGLRNILSVLRSLGAAKKANKKDSENTIVMRVLRDMNMSKLVDEDEPLFMSLINDLFPDINLDTKGYPELQAAIVNQAEESGLIAHPPWVLKLIQLYETQSVRHGIMTLGPSGSGKTSCIHTLMKALTQCGELHREIRMNPKAITAPQMFGRLDVTTNDWTDGVFSTLWRKTLKAKKGEHIWLVLDGPVDAFWIENLNSVLDDNKTLTLANGDRIPMSSSCKIIFEPQNVDNASPATVSRAGMVYMSSSALNWVPFMKSWLKKITTIQEALVIDNLFELYFAEVIQWAKQNLHFVMDILECNLITQMTTLLEGLLPSFKPEDSALIKDIDDNETLEKHYHRIFAFALMWTIGSFVETADRIKLENYLCGTNFELDLPVLEHKFQDDNIFNYMVNEKGFWQPWSVLMDDYAYPDNYIPDFTTILVPHISYLCIDYLIHTASKQGKAVLMLGEQGTAKTVTIKAYMQKFTGEAHLSKSFNFSSASTPMFFQRTIESFVDKRMGNIFGPGADKKMTVFIDDLNMPAYNEWGDQVTNEIVRQTIEMNGFYNLEKPGDFSTIVGIQFLAAMRQPGSGSNSIPSRLKRHFTIYNCTLPSDESIDRIFSVMACGYYCGKRGFVGEVRNVVRKLVPVTRELLKKTKLQMLPTPANFHYVFNLRDLSRIWQGMLGTLSSVIDTENLVIALWKHECTRVLSDRFTHLENCVWFDNTVLEVVHEYLGNKFKDMASTPHYFVDFLRDAPEPTGEENEDQEQEQPKVYEPIESFEALEERLKMYLIQYNEMIRGNGLDLVFFKDAMIHLVRVSRIIRTAGGNALLVGVGGSGKQSLTKIASFIAGYRTFQLTLTRSYNVTNFVEDLKVLYRTTGIQGKGTTFIFTEQDVKEEGFLEYLNSLLVSGVIYNLFTKEEQSEIMTELLPTMRRENPEQVVNLETTMEYFLYRCKQNLHVVLCFSPVGEKFRNRAFNFPGLVSGCTIDWFQPWPRDALVAVAQHFLSDYKVICTSEVKTELVKIMGCIQDGVADYCVEYFQRFRRSCHVTPKSYLSFVNSYKSVYSQKQDEINVLTERMDTGLAKLQEASLAVVELKVELDTMEQNLAVASQTAEEVLLEVCHRAHEAEQIRNKVSESKDRAEELVRQIAIEKGIAEEKLDQARPALEEAEAALNTIKPAHIATVRKLGRPPHLIMRIMDCVLILFSKKMQPVKPDPEVEFAKPSWAESLKMMSNTNFLQMLQTFPKDTINDEMVELLEPYLEMPDYNMDMGRRVCGDVAGLLSWTKAMVFFYGINKEVLPLKTNLAKQEVRLSAAIETLTLLQEDLDEKQSELGSVKSQYEDALFKKDTLVNQANSCRRKMDAATTLITGLGGEKQRWTEQSKEFKSQLGRHIILFYCHYCHSMIFYFSFRLVGDILVATAFLSYAGPFNQEFRNILLNSWQNMLSNCTIPYTPKINIVEMFVGNSTIAEWMMQSLPNDELSIQNGIIVTKALCYPLLIDPQGQGKTWIKNKDSKFELQITSLNHKYFRTHLEDSLSLGRPLLVEDIGLELDPILDNLLEKNFIKAGSSFKVILGDKECDIVSGFMLYMTTKLANPAFTPEISAKTAIIDFAVTMQGLEDQLLGRVILTEKSELESERVQLIEQVMKNKQYIKQLEDNLLHRLTSTECSLVDDEDLIDVLQHTKATAKEVSEKLLGAADTERKINLAREQFRPVAVRGSILYFLIVEMSTVNYMYQTSLRQFLILFDQSLERSARSINTDTRITNINSYLTYEIYNYSIRGFYERHKFLFSVLMALKIELNAGNISHQEFMTFIKGGASLDLKAVIPKPFRWILDITWLNLVELSKLPQFTNILNQICENEKQWKNWYDSEFPENEIIPNGYNDNLDHFRRLLLIRCWCLDRTISQARAYIVSSLGEQYSEGYVLDLDSTWKESNEKTPMICFLSMGSDPTDQIECLSKKVHIDLKMISMGQGQEIHARRLLSSSMANGSWALLQNCHLSLQFCEEVMETLVETENCNPDFRLWITTEPHLQFPIGLLQMAIKFTNEPPQGIKASLKRSYNAISQDVLDYSRVQQWQTLLYTVAFLHTIVQERRKYGPLGWNIPYEFNQADFNGSVQFVQNHLDEVDIKKGVCWTTICYMLAEVQYGGRVTDDFDKRLLNSYLELWFNEDLFYRNFTFFKGYAIPNCVAISLYLDYINTLPSFDSSEIFGLHPNAEITYQINTAQEVLDIILNVQPKESGTGGGETREVTVRRLTNDMIGKLPPDYIVFEVRDALQRMGTLMPMNIFLRQEVDRMQRVIQQVRATLQDLLLAIDGTIIMSEELRDGVECIYDARVPTNWKKVSWESSTLGFWFTELVERNNQFNRWLKEGRPDVFWMTGFFNPQGFLTAMRQEITRAHKGWALDSVVLQNTVTRFSKEEIRCPPEEGIYLHGLFVEGAGWDRKKGNLVESRPKVLFELMPIVHMYAATFVKDKDAGKLMYECPIYKKSQRGTANYITSIDLKTDVSPYHWIFRGVALLCDIK
uniref:AAA+ ATPase domain-containing protein n=1 Tax=Strigamia maritima TaxID=126957 RepID=T1J281_STRMM